MHMLLVLRSGVLAAQVMRYAMNKNIPIAKVSPVFHVLRSPPVM